MKRPLGIVLSICWIYGICGCQPAGELTSEDKRVQGLITRLNSRSHQGQIDAAVELGDIGPNAHPAIPYLVGKLRNRNVDLTLTAMGALGKIGPASRVAIPILMEYLYSENHLHYLGAAAALGEIGPEAYAAVPKLAEMLECERVDMHWGSELARALGNMGPRAAGAVPAMIRAFKIKPDESSGELNIQYDEVSLEIALALGRIGPPAKSAIPVLVEALQSTHPPRMSQAAAAGLAGIGGPYGDEVAAVLVKAIETPLSRLSASGAKDRSSLRDAFDALEPRARMRQEMIPFALAVLPKVENTQQVIPAAIAVLKTHPVGRFRKAAVRCLGQITPASRSVTRALRVAAAIDKDPSVEAAAVLALVRIEPSNKNIIRIMDLLVESPGTLDRLEAIDILADMGPAAKMALPALKKLLKDEDNEVRDVAARAIRKIQGKQPPSR